MLYIMLFLIFQKDEMTKTDGEFPEAIDKIEYDTSYHDNNNDHRPETAPKHKNG